MDYDLKIEDKRLSFEYIYFFSLKMANQIINSLKIQNNSNLYTTQTRQQRMCNEKNWVIVWNIKNVKVHALFFIWTPIFRSQDKFSLEHTQDKLSLEDIINFCFAND